MARIDKSERPKVAAYRDTLHKMAKTPDRGKKHLEGDAAKLGLEIQGEESKAAPRPKSKPRKNPN